MSANPCVLLTFCFYGRSLFCLVTPVSPCYVVRNHNETCFLIYNFLVVDFFHIFATAYIAMKEE